ncbi:MAG: hypothetical protein ACLP1Q_13815 [Solirubrobacteraceae bacterium]
MPSALAFALSALVWLAPPPVLPFQSRTGPEGPPRPVTITPPFGAEAPATNYASVRAQNRALLEGPFPSDGLQRGISDGQLLLSEPAAVRELALSRIREAGARVVRIPVNWNDIVSAAPGPGFVATDPASVEYHFALIDAAVRGTVSAGLTPLIVVSHAPAFAEAAPRWRFAYPGSWDPSPEALRAFATALAIRYDGSFPDPLDPARPLPRVRLFQAWNEPNLARYLEPQWVARDGQWRAFSPSLYRELLNGFYAGVKSVAPDDVVIAAGVAPNGDPAGVGRMAPVSFLRSLLCLPSTSAQRAAQCPEPPHFEVLAFHPLSVGNPDVPAPSSLEVSISDAAKVTGLLRQAERDHTAQPEGEKRVWVTELDWESQPQSPQGVRPRLQAAWVSRALHRLWVAGVSLVSWEYLVDPFHGVRLSTPTGGIVEVPRPAGLYAAGAGGQFASATPKPFLRGFAFPFDPLRVDARHVRVWALLMRARQPVALQRERGAGGAWRTIARLHANSAGVVNVLIGLGGAARLRLQSGLLISAVASVPAGRSRV